jgi:hypothetical protein
VVAQVVLAELAGVVAEIEQELGERRGAGPQIGGTARQLRRDHAGPHRIHAGEEGIAAGRAALHGDVVHEDRAFLPDAVDVGRFPDHQAAVVDARLHPADVVAHDEENVGLRLLRGCRHACRHDSGKRCQQTEPDGSGHAHGCFLNMAARDGPAALRPLASSAARSSRQHSGHARLSRTIRVFR